MRGLQLHQTAWTNLQSEKKSRWRDVSGNISTETEHNSVISHQPNPVRRRTLFTRRWTLRSPGQHTQCDAGQRQPCQCDSSVTSRHELVDEPRRRAVTRRSHSMSSGPPNASAFDQCPLTRGSRASKRTVIAINFPWHLVRRESCSSPLGRNPSETSISAVATLSGLKTLPATTTNPVPRNLRQQPWSENT